MFRIEMKCVKKKYLTSMTSCVIIANVVGKLCPDGGLIFETVTGLWSE